MKTKNIICLFVSVVILATTFFTFASGEPTVPQKTQIYKTTGYTSWSAFKSNCDSNFSKISLYPKTVNPMVSNGRLVFGGTGKKNMVMEFPNYLQTSSAKYPANGIKGTMVLREYVDLLRCPIILYSYAALDSCPELTWAKEHKGHPVNAYNGIKFICRVSANSGISIGYYNEVYYYDKTTDQLFANGTVSVGYKELWTDYDIVNKESDSYLGPGTYYLKGDSVLTNFHLRYENVYNETTKKYETKILLDIDGTYDIYENQVVGSNPQKIQTKTFKSSIDISPYSPTYYKTKTMAIGSYSNTEVSRREEYFSDITVEYDLSEYYSPTAKQMDAEYKQKVDKADKTVEDLESVRTEYNNAVDKLDKNIREYISYEEIIDYIDKAVGEVVNSNYNKAYTFANKTKSVLTKQLNDFLTEYNGYSAGVKKYIDYYTIKERLEDKLYTLRDQNTATVEKVTISSKTGSTVVFTKKQGYEYALVEKSVIDTINANQNLSAESKKTLLRRAYNWQDSTEFADLKPETEYYACWRIKATEDINESAIDSITVKTNALPGDINHDGEFNAKDITYLCEAIVGKHAVETDISDINKDGKVNVGDILYLKKILLNYSGYTF